VSNSVVDQTVSTPDWISVLLFLYKKNDILDKSSWTLSGNIFFNVPTSNLHFNCKNHTIYHRFGVEAQTFLFSSQM
jgi:hypothetical protein